MPHTRWATRAAELAREAIALPCACAALGVACDSHPGTVLNRSEHASDSPQTSTVPERLGALGNIVPVLDEPDPNSDVIGYLHAGAKLARASEPRTAAGCAEGWYAVFPKGFVCAGGSATLDLTHPTLAVMAIAPNLEASLPYAYARVTQPTALFEVDPSQPRTVRPVSEVPQGSGMAIVGSWVASDPEGLRHRLGLLTDGRFIDADALQAAIPSDFEGVELGDEKTQLPLGFVKTRGAQRVELSEGVPRVVGTLAYQSALGLGATTTTALDVTYWALADGNWVRQENIARVLPVDPMPIWAEKTSRWIDINLTEQTLVLYEGTRPTFATLVSVGARAGEPDSATDTALQSTARGEFVVAFKHVTLAAADAKSFASKVELFDVPWALELDSGQDLHAAYWHDRFGSAAGNGSVQLAVRDARRVFMWSTPELPPDWHGAAPTEEITPTRVSIHE